MAEVKIKGIIQGYTETTESAFLGGANQSVRTELLPKPNKIISNFPITIPRRTDIRQEYVEQFLEYLRKGKSIPFAGTCDYDPPGRITKFIRARRGEKNLDRPVDDSSYTLLVGVDLAGEKYAISYHTLYLDRGPRKFSITSL